MDIDSATVHKIKSLLAENKKEEARNILVTELGITHADATSYVDRLAELVELKQGHTDKKFNKNLVAFVFLGLGVVFTALTAFFVVQKQQTLANSYLTTGVVIGFSVGGSEVYQQIDRNDRETSYAPVIRYQVNGKEYQVVGGVAASPPMYELNEEIEIYVDNDNPLDITINSFFNKWFMVLIFGLFAVIFDMIGVLILVLKPKLGTSTMDMFDRDEERLNSFDDFD